LTVVLVNPATAAVVELALGGQAPSTTDVTRSVFPGVERSSDLGALPSNGIVTLPGESILTVAVRR
jgi:hypothetical protein